MSHASIMGGLLLAILLVLHCEVGRGIASVKIRNRATTERLSLSLGYPSIARYTRKQSLALNGKRAVISRLWLQSDNSDLPIESNADSRNSLISIQTFMFTALAALAIAISYADRANLSTAIIPMSASLHWDSFFSGLVLSAFWAGYACTQIIGGNLSDRFGGENILLTAIVMWSAFTALTPEAAAASTAASSLPILLTRVMLGAGEGLALPSIHSMIKKYIKSSARNTVAGVVTAACYLGTLASNIIAPQLIMSTGTWETTFLYFAIIPIVIWVPLWILFIRKFPVIDQTDNSGKDVDKFRDESTSLTVSWFELLKQKPVWAIIAAQYGQSWGMIGLLSWLPTYYSEKFNVSISSLGWFTATPYFLQLIIAMAAGFVADRFIEKGYRVLNIRHVLQITGMVVPAICLGICAYFPNLQSLQAAILITLGSSISSLTVGGVSCNQFDICPSKAGTIFGIGNTASCLAGLIAVPIAGYIYNTTHSWDIIFTLFAVHYIGGAALWYLWASDKRIDVSIASNND